MVKKKAQVLAAAAYGIDMAATVASFYLAYWIRDTWFTSFDKLFGLAQYHWLLLFIIPIWTAALFYAGAYRFSLTSSLVRDLVRAWTAVLVGALALAALIFLYKTLYFSRLFLAVFVASNLLTLTVTRLVFYKVVAWGLRSEQNRRNVIIVGTGGTARNIGRLVAEHRGWGFNLLGYIREDDTGGEAGGLGAPVIGTIGDIPELVRKSVVDEVIFAVSRERVEELENIFLFLEDHGINARLALDIFPHMIARVHIEEIGDTPLLTFTTIPTNEVALLVKRLVDIVLSAAALVLLSPLFAVIPVLIKLTSPGPVLFVQKRCGLNGRVFDFYKFRSMYVGSEKMKPRLASLNENDGPAFKMRNDPRITPVGRFLRKTSLDELPQFWNVLKGDMSIVGPRPPIPSEVARYERWQRRRLSMKPGLTCLWQVSGRSLLHFHDWMRLDLQYIDNWSLWLDIKIMFKTIPAVFSGKGAY